MIDQHKTLSEKFLKKGFWLYIFSFIIAPIWYIIKIIISNELSVTEVGILYWVISLITLVSAFNDFGMTESLNYFLPWYITKKRYDKVKSILIYAILTQTITWIIIAWFFFFWDDYIALHYFKSIESSNILKIFSLYFLWINIFQVLSTFFMSVQNTFYNKINEFFRMFFTMLSVLFIFITNNSTLINYSYTWIIWLYIWIIISINLFYLKYYKTYLKKEKILWSKKLFKKIFSYAIWVVIWAQAATILGQMDMQMIIYLLWTKEAWYYTNYLSIIWIPFMLIGPIFWLLFPIFSELHAKKDFTKIKLVKQIFQKNFLAVGIAFNILFFVFAPIIAYILFWTKFIESWYILRYSILFLTFNFLLQINFNIFAWIWQIKTRVKIISIALVFNFILNLILINYIWVYWAALATWLWWILIWLLSEYYLWKKYLVNLDYKFLTKNIILIWLLWIFSYYFINPIFQWLSRWISFWMMFIIWILWFGIFGLINLKEFKGFILEVKRLKK